MISKIFAFAIFFFTTFFSLVTALPARVPVIRDVYVPPVISPNATTVWTIGETYVVTWNTTNPPAQISNPRGNIYLRQADATFDHALALNFSILAGSQEVTVPRNVTAGNDYRIVLYGDSGDWSDVFTIAAATSD